jgi:exonuclease VII small subunit
MIEKDMPFLNQLIQSLEETQLKLEEAYNRKDIETFNKTKKFMMQIQEKISEII